MVKDGDALKSNLPISDLNLCVEINIVYYAERTELTLKDSTLALG